MADETNAGGATGPEGQESPITEVTGQAGQTETPSTPAEGAPPPAETPKKKKKHRALWVTPLVIVILAIGVFVAILLVYPLFKALNVDLQRNYNEETVNGAVVSVDMYATLKNENSFDWPKTELLMDIPVKGTYYCKLEATGAYETAIPKDGSVVYRFALAKNAKTGQEEAISLSKEEFKETRFEVRVDFTGIDDFWIKMRKNFGMDTKNSMKMAD